MFSKRNEAHKILVQPVKKHFSFLEIYICFKINCSHSFVLYVQMKQQQISLFPEA